MFMGNESQFVKSKWVIDFVAF